MTGALGGPVPLGGEFVSAEPKTTTDLQLPVDNVTVTDKGPPVVVSGEVTGDGGKKYTITVRAATETRARELIQEQGGRAALICIATGDPIQLTGAAFDQLRKGTGTGSSAVFKGKVSTIPSGDIRTYFQEREQKIQNKQRFYGGLSDFCQKLEKGSSKDTIWLDGGELSFAAVKSYFQSNGMDDQLAKDLEAVLRGTPEKIKDLFSGNKIPSQAKIQEKIDKWGDVGNKMKHFKAAAAVAKYVSLSLSKGTGAPTPSPHSTSSSLFASASPPPVPKASSSIPPVSGFGESGKFFGPQDDGCDVRCKAWGEKLKALDKADAKPKGAEELPHSSSSLRYDEQINIPKDGNHAFAAVLFLVAEKWDRDGVPERPYQYPKDEPAPGEGVSIPDEGLRKKHNSGVDIYNKFLEAPNKKQFLLDLDVKDYDDLMFMMRFGAFYTEGLSDDERIALANPEEDVRMDSRAVRQLASNFDLNFSVLSPSSKGGFSPTLKGKGGIFPSGDAAVLDTGDGFKVVYNRPPFSEEGYSQFVSLVRAERKFSEQAKKETTFYLTAKDAKAALATDKDKGSKPRENMFCYPVRSNGVIYHSVLVRNHSGEPESVGFYRSEQLIAGLNWLSDPKKYDPPV